MSKKRLSVKERDLLVECEAVMLQYNHAFLAVGRVLMEIRDNDLYRETHPTFEAYLLGRWDMSRAYAYRLIDAAGVVDDLSPMGDILPANERQARPLAPLETNERLGAWKRVVERAAGERITAALVAETVDEYLDMLSEGEKKDTGGQTRSDDVFGRVSDIKRKLKRMETKPEYVKFCQRTEAKLKKLFEEVEQTYAAAMKAYLEGK